MDKSYKVSKYLDYLKKNIPIGICDSAEIVRYINALNFIEDLESNELILETKLSEQLEYIDLSIKIDKKNIFSLEAFMNDTTFDAILETSKIWNKIKSFKNYWKAQKSSVINDIWFEFDRDSTNKELIEPCFFFDSSNCYKNDEFMKPLSFLTEGENIKDNFKGCISKLPKDRGLFQLGAMLSRNEETVRVFTNELSYIEVLEYLKRINWDGDIKKLEEFICIFNGYSDKQYILDFNISSNDISTKIGINFGLNLNKKNITEDFVKRLVDLGMCNKRKSNGVLQWLNTSYVDEIEKDISHFKFTFDKDYCYIKAYLRISPLLITLGENIEKW